VAQATLLEMKRKDMSRYQHLPLYDALYRFTREMYKIKTLMPKSLKYDLGEAVCKSALRALKLVVFANGSEKKDAPLRDLALEIETLWVYLRLLHDQKGLSLGQFEVIGKKLTEISKQVSAWRKWYKEELRKMSSQKKS
jgi:hypothetical protein